MNSVRLYYIDYVEAQCSQLDEAVVSSWLAELSENKQYAVQRLLKYSDRITSLLGLRLLKKCAQDEDIKGFQLRDVVHPETGKPYWHNTSATFDFNVSHSDNLIIVAASKKLKVGVDAEKIKPLKRLSFKMVMSASELEQIKSTPPLFFEFWSKKEAVVKAAETAGLSRMRDVALTNEVAVFDQKDWYLQGLSQQLGYAGEYAIHLAASKPVDELIVKQISINELL